MTTPQKPKVTITYCIGCNWMLRAARMAQELLSTFQDLLGSVTLVPGEVGGVFEISVNDELIWERKRDGGFPDVKELKTRVRDQINPQQDLGHLDRAKSGE